HRLFLLTHPPPPQPPLFPYTTLFRSRHRARPLTSVNRHGGHFAEEGREVMDRFLRYVGAEVGYAVAALSACAAFDRRLYFTLAKDRKSTRLNSSHGSISYAVFCLKKK